MSGKSVRQHFMKEFRGLRRNAPAVAGLTVASYVSQVLVAIGLGQWLLQFPLSVPTVTGLALLMLFIATRLRGFNNIVHECSHFTFCEGREQNEMFGSICASLILGSFRDYREEHMTHHAHLGDYDKDQDLHGIRDLRLEEPLTPSTILRHLLTAASGLHLPYYLSVNLSARDGTGYAWMKMGIIALAVGFLLLDPVAALLLVWLPFIWIFTAINYLTDCVDHGGLVEAGDELESSRNLLVPKQLKVLLFPRNDCYHLVHHLFPQVPSDHLGACHERLLTDPNYRARTKAPILGRTLETGAESGLHKPGWAFE